jgi:hypothetical protein
MLAHNSSSPPTPPPLTSVCVLDVAISGLTDEKKQVDFPFLPNANTGQNLLNPVVSFLPTTMSMCVA